MPGEWSQALVPAGIGDRLHSFAAEIFPICRSITGNGVRETLNHIERIIPLERTEVATGTPVLDWTIPNEWTIRDAHISDESGRRVVDLAASDWDWQARGEPPVDHPAYYLRFCKTFHRMGGTLRYLCADNRAFFLALDRALEAAPAGREGSAT